MNEQCVISEKIVPADVAENKDAAHIELGLIMLNDKKPEISESDLYKKPYCYFAAFIAGLRKCKNLVKLDFYREPFNTGYEKESKSRVVVFFERLLEVMHAVNQVYVLR